MLLAILADIHGNVPALEAVLADMQNYPLQGVIVAGDFTGGPRPLEVIDRLQSLAASLVRGNAENYMLDIASGRAPQAWLTSKAWATTRWCYSQLNSAALQLIAAAPEQMVLAMPETAPIRVLHGSLRSPSEHTIPDQNPAAIQLYREAGILLPDQKPYRLADSLYQIPEPVLVSAHSHIPWLQHENDRLAVNPGSVGAPNNQDPRAQYALLAWTDAGWQATHRAVPYNLAQAQADYRDSGMLECGGTFAYACMLALANGQNIPGKFVAHAFQLTAQAGLAGCQVIPDELWEEATRSFPWQAYQ